MPPTPHHPTTPSSTLGRRTILAGAAALGVTAAWSGAAVAHAAGQDASPDTRPRIAVTDHGATGDGATDDSVAILAADAAAAAVGGVVHFPSGTYRGWGLLPTASWEGPGQGTAVIQSARQVHGVDTSNFLRVVGATGLTYDRLTFDGWVTEDPVQWSAGTMHGFDGAVPFILSGASGVRLRHCTFRNAYGSPLRIEYSHDVSVEDCTMRRARNPWADGTYVTASTNIRYRRCHARDYTRIGFVAENQSAEGTHDVSYEDCTASGGHDSSILYGGTEYNAGFWSENSVGSRYERCTSSDNTHFGFIIASGPYTRGAATAVVSNAVSTGNPAAFKVSSWGNVPVAATLVNCTARAGNGVAKAPSAGFLFTPRYNADRVTISRSSSHIPPTLSDPDTTHIRVEALLPAVTAAVAVSDCHLIGARRPAGADDVRALGTYQGTITLDRVKVTPRRPLQVAAVDPATPSWVVSNTDVAGI